MIKFDVDDELDAAEKAREFVADVCYPLDDLARRNNTVS